MQFDPGMEYRPDWGFKNPAGQVTGPPTRGLKQRPGPSQPGNAGAKNPPGNPGPGGPGVKNPAAPGGKEDKSWLMLCSALTDGPYSYIWSQAHYIKRRTMMIKIVPKFQLLLRFQANSYQYANEDLWFVFLLTRKYELFHCLFE